MTRASQHGYRAPCSRRGRFGGREPSAAVLGLAACATGDDRLRAAATRRGSGGRSASKAASREPQVDELLDERLRDGEMDC